MWGGISVRNNIRETQSLLTASVSRSRISSAGDRTTTKASSLDLESPVHQYQQLNLKSAENNNIDTPEQSPSSSWNCDPSNYLVLLKSGTVEKYQKRRAQWRESDCPAIYNQFNITYRFMLGLPAHEEIDPKEHDQFKRASQEEVEDMIRIHSEVVNYTDTEILSMKDVYNDFHLKTLRMFEWAVDRGMTGNTSMVVFHDDDFCLEPNVLQAACERVSSDTTKTSLYGGVYLWDVPVYDQQKHFDGSFAPYFSGNLYALSSDLVQDIARDPASFFTSVVATNSEDLQVGAWVLNQVRKKSRKVAYINESRLKSEQLEV